ncbi:PREDICTED: acetoacetyl-CoA synthetase [Thamnophis sirtalis]|uniref:Acetoacetyl-CoA synthetase n=1 Tax=Thamnophis sirtalis TaxID=35019 RepID=A0A6I9YMQ1_9SAUR|nr:PREDICTED: acetoacetyl-CoA synthetase [Thamnophis sirtalis]
MVWDNNKKEKSSIHCLLPASILQLRCFFLTCLPYSCLGSLPLSSSTWLLNTGWMMWNWLVSALAVGASVVLYDGSPLVPSPNVLWDLVDRLGITILGTGAKWLAVLEEKNLKPCKY